MPILNPDHLIAQGRDLIHPAGAGKPRQVALRRAISDAYYAVFHFTCTALADHWIGYVHRRTERYALVYRAVEHRALASFCGQIVQGVSGKFLRYVPAGGFGPDMKAFAASVSDLQEKRHGADYDPVLRFRYIDAKLTLDSSEAAMRRFTAAHQGERDSFLTLLLTKPR